MTSNEHRHRGVRDCLPHELIRWISQEVKETERHPAVPRGPHDRSELGGTRFMFQSRFGSSCLPLASGSGSVTTERTKHQMESA
jgi:hypothetical protein